MDKKYYFWLAGALFLAIITACLAVKTPNSPNDDNLRYMYITCWPDECRLTVIVEFKDNTPVFHEERTTREFEAIAYSVNKLKVKTITIKAEKYGWVTQVKKWEGEVPYDVFIKLEERL